MKQKSFACSAVTMLAVILVIGIGSAEAFENITAQEAYDLVNSGQATLIDLRTLEECYWVGMPAVVPGGLYIIPWQTETINPDGTVTQNANPDFDDLIFQEFGDNTQALILMCRSGSRSTAAAIHLEDDLYFTNVYEIDNALKEAANSTGGRGGFQGTSYSGAYDGYRGYPQRLPSNQNPKRVTVQTDTDRIRNQESSVSWMDTGLPMTQDFNNAIIPVLE